jgi:hypothetical protein
MIVFGMRAEVHQPIGTLDAVNMYGDRMFTARVPARPSGVESRLRLVGPT